MHLTYSIRFRSRRIADFFTNMCQKFRVEGVSVAVRPPLSPEGNPSCGETERMACSVSGEPARGRAGPGSFLLFGTPKKRPRVFPGMSVAKNAEPPASSCVTACSSFPDDFRSGARPGRAPRRDARRRIAPGTCQPGKSAAPQKGPRAHSRGRGVQESARQTGRTYFQKRWQSW